MACGVFIGCLPLYGLHLLICGAVGTIFRLNRLKMYLAANLSNPFVAPAAGVPRDPGRGMAPSGLVSSGQRGGGEGHERCHLRRGSVRRQHRRRRRAGVVAGGLTYAVVRRKRGGGDFDELVRLASDRYIDAGIVAWEFARAKLKSDPIYRACISGGLLTSVTDVDDPTGVDSGRTLLDHRLRPGPDPRIARGGRRAQGSGRWPPAWPALAIRSPGWRRHPRARRQDCVSGFGW